MIEAAGISRDDLLRLSRDPSGEERARIAEKLSHTYAGDVGEQLSDSENKVAEDIFRVLVRDAEVNVRKALSENLKNSPDVPKDIVMPLAKDVAEVALPVLEYSEVLDEEDLVEIISNTDEDHHVAIANRRIVPEKVSDALVDTNSDKVVNTVLMNDGARILENTFDKVIDNFSDNERVVESLITNGSLPADVAERVITKVSTEIQQQLAKKYDTSFTDINKFFKRTTQVATFKLMGLEADEEEMAHIIEDMEKAGSLTPVSALCMGNLNLFYVSMARHAKIPLTNAKKLVSDLNGHGFESLLRVAEIPERMHEAVRLVARGLIYMEAEAGKHVIGRKEYGDQLIEFLHSKTDGQEIEGLSYFVKMIRHSHSDGTKKKEDSGF